MAGTVEKCSKQKFSEGWKTLFLTLIFGSTVNGSFNYMFFHHCTIIYSSTLQKLPDLEDVMAHFYLNFLN